MCSPDLKQDKGGADQAPAVLARPAPITLVFAPHTRAALNLLGITISLHAAGL